MGWTILFFCWRLMTSYLINESLMQATGHHVLNGVCPNLTTALKSGLRSGPKEDLSDPTNESSKMEPKIWPITGLETVNSNSIRSGEMEQDWPGKDAEIFRLGKKIVKHNFRTYLRYSFKALLFSIKSLNTIGWREFTD